MAPRVPGYQPYPTVDPSQQGLPGFNVRTPGEAFGGGIGEGVAAVGKELEKVGGQLFERAVALQTTANEAEAKEAESEYLIATGKMHADYNALQGKDAVDAYPKYVEDLRGLRAKMREGLSNDDVRRRFDGPSLGTMGRTIHNGAGHAASQNKRYVAGASAAKLDAEREAALQSPEDEVNFQRSLKNIDTEVYGTQMHVFGWSPEQAKKAADEYKSKLLASRITGLARKQPFLANDLLEANRKNLQSEDIERVERTVQTQMNTTGSRNIASKQTADLYEGRDDGRSLQQRLDDAHKEADRVAPNDPLFKDYVTQHVISNFSRSKAIKRDFDFDNKQTIDGAMVGGYGTLPTTVDELVALDPKVQSAWEHMPPAQQRSYMKALAQNAKGETVSWTNESLARYQQLKGMAQEDPEEFLVIDPIAEKFPRSAQRELINLQQKMKSKPEQDPRVTRAMRILAPMLQVAGVTPTNNKDDYMQFVGAMQDTITDWMEHNKKTPPVKDIQLMGARLLQEKAVGYSSRMIDPSGWGKESVFKVAVPEKDAEAIKADPTWTQLGITPTDSMVQRIYTRKLYQKLYGSPTKAEDYPNAPKAPVSR